MIIIIIITIIVIMLLTDLGHVVNPVKFATTVLAAVKCGETLVTSFHLKENKNGKETSLKQAAKVFIHI